MPNVLILEYESLKVFTYRLPKIIYSVGSSFGKYDLLQLSGCAQLLHLAFVGVEVLGVSIERRKSLHNSRSILIINVYLICFKYIIMYYSGEGNGQKNNVYIIHCPIKIIVCFMGGKGILSNLEIEKIEPPQSACMY